VARIASACRQSPAIFLALAEVSSPSPIDKGGIPEPIIGKISQETLAGIVGTTRSRISQFMNKFRKLGLIDYNGQIVVHNSLLNVVLNDNPHLKTRTEPPSRSSGRTASIA
jgi:hypothetical protein